MPYNRLLSKLPADSVFRRFSPPTMAPDSGRRGPESWRKVAVLCGCFLNHIVGYGAAWGSGVFQMIFMDEFGKGGVEGAAGSSAALVSVVPTLIPATMSFVGPLASALTNRLGCQWVVVIGTLMVALGFATSAAAETLPLLCVTFTTIGAGVGLVFIPSIVILTHYFKRRLPIAVGIGSSGLGVGVFVFPPLIRLLEKEWNWRVAVVIYAVLSLVMLASAWVFQPLAPPPPSPARQLSTTSTASARRRKTLRVKMMRQPPFICLLLNNIVLLYGMIGFYVHLPSHIRSLGFDKSEAAMFPSVAGIATLVARLLAGFLAQQIPAPLSLYTASMVIGGLAVIAVAFLSSHGALMLACVVYGFSTATLGPLLPLIVEQLVGKEAIGDGYGYIMVAEGIGSLLGPPVAGALYDASESYQVSLCVAGAAMILSSVIMLYPLYHVWTRAPLQDVLMATISDCQPDATKFVHPSGESGALLLSATDASLSPDAVAQLIAKEAPDPDDAAREASVRVSFDGDKLDESAENGKPKEPTPNETDSGHETL